MAEKVIRHNYSDFPSLESDTPFIPSTWRRQVAYLSSVI